MPFEITLHQGKIVVVQGLEKLGLPADDPTPSSSLLSILQNHAQKLVDHGLGFDSLTIQGRFGSGVSGACVFPVVLSQRGKDSRSNVYQVLKYDRHWRIVQEQKRYNGLLSGQHHSTSIFPWPRIEIETDQQMALLALPDLRSQVFGVRDFLEGVNEFLQAGSKTKANLWKTRLENSLDKVLEELYEAVYRNHEHRVNIDGRNLSIGSIFADLFPAETAIEENCTPAEDWPGPGAAGLLDLDLAKDGESALAKDGESTENWLGQWYDSEVDKRGYLQKRYLIQEKEIIRFTRADLQTSQMTPEPALPPLRSERPTEEIRGQKTSAPLSQRIGEWVRDSGFALDAEQMYDALQGTLPISYYAERLHRDLNPHNILLYATMENANGAWLIDYFSFGTPGHLFSDLVRLEGLLILDAIALGWIDGYDFLLSEDTLRKKCQTMEKFLTLLGTAESASLQPKETALLNLAMRIRARGLLWLEDAPGNPREKYFNYLWARYAFLLSYSKMSVAHLAEPQKRAWRYKKNLALLSAEALRKTMQSLATSPFVDTIFPHLKKIVEKPKKKWSSALARSTVVLLLLLLAYGLWLFLHPTFAPPLTLEIFQKPNSVPNPVICAAVEPPLTLEIFRSRVQRFEGRTTLVDVQKVDQAMFSEDHYYLELMVRKSVYVYGFQRDSSSKIYPLFPAPWKEYEGPYHFNQPVPVGSHPIPPELSFTLDEISGTEDFLFLYSDEPLENPAAVLQDHLQGKRRYPFLVERRVNHEPWTNGR